ncbi:MAG: hypothetical protein KF749_01610 [Bacteroidetes bacterium]|nr:hypothetical protein [Bacteroidota bacterium]MCW5896211.1 hypothetical protein [Bacteroidota bacterium]
MQLKVLVCACLIVAMVCGCESPVDSELAMGDSHSIDAEKARTSGGRIPLVGILPEPGSQTQYSMDGFVDYGIARVPEACSLVELDLGTAVCLRALECDKPMCTIQEKSTHMVCVSEEGVALLEIRYLIQERNDRLALIVQFQVTQDNLEIDAVSLDYIE